MYMLRNLRYIINIEQHAGEMRLFVMEMPAQRLSALVLCKDEGLSSGVHRLRFSGGQLQPHSELSDFVSWARALALMHTPHLPCIDEASRKVSDPPLRKLAYLVRLGHLA